LRSRPGSGMTTEARGQLAIPSKEDPNAPRHAGTPVGAPAKRERERFVKRERFALAEWPSRDANAAQKLSAVGKAGGKTCLWSVGRAEKMRPQEVRPDFARAQPRPRRDPAGCDKGGRAVGPRRLFRPRNWEPGSQREIASAGGVGGRSLASGAPGFQCKTEISFAPIP
jgi:hypothetical protein